MKLGVTLDILNQKDTPAFFADILANRPAAGFTGRIFVDTNVPSTGLYRDTGSSWIQIADQGAGTTGTLQQVTTNGNTTSQGISITAGGLSSNIVTIAGNGLGSTTNYIGQTMATNDNWKIFGTGSTSDVGEMVFQVGDNGSSYASGNGERFRFSYDASSTGTARDSFIIDYDTSYFNTSVGINTPTPTAAFDVHSDVNVIAQLNQTIATNNSLLAFQNANSGLWRIGNFYNSGANDWGIFDVVGAIQPLTIKKTTGQTFIGAQTTSSGRLVVNDATGDNHIVVIGATAPSIRINNAGSGATKQIGIGLATTTNNFIQGSADRDMCIFNGSTTASPMLFGIYGTTNVQEAARISPARNFLIGTTTDSGEKLQISGTSYFNGTGRFSGQLSIGGNFGIQTTTPTTSLQIGNGSGLQQIYLTGGGYDLILGTSGGGLFGFASQAISGIFNTTTTPLGVGTNTSQALILGTSNQERARFTSGGNLLIGTTTDAGQKLQVNGSGLFTGNLNLASGGDNLSLSRTSFTTWGLGIGTVGGISGLHIGTSTTYLSFSETTGEATFTSGIKINNTVTASVLNTVTNKVSIVIGGVQYYLLASTSSV